MRKVAVTVKKAGERMHMEGRIGGLALISECVDLRLSDGLFGHPTPPAYTVSVCQHAMSVPNLS